MTTWTAPVRFGEVDAQGVVFNSHYLLYCDEAANAFYLARDLREVALHVRLVSSQLVWSGSARWGDVISVDVRCNRVGRTSLTLSFAITADQRSCCTVETTYVLVDAAGRPTPLPEQARAALSDS